MPYINTTQGVNVSSGIGQGEAQVFNPYVVKTDVTAKDFVDLQQKQAKVKLEADKEKKESIKEAGKLLTNFQLLQKDAKLLPKYSNAISKDFQLVADDLVEHLKENDGSVSPIKQAELNAKIQDLSFKLGTAKQITEDYNKKGAELLDAEQKENVDIFGQDLYKGINVPTFDGNFNDEVAKDASSLSGIGFSKYNNYSDVIGKVQKGMKSESESLYNTRNMAGATFVETTKKDVYNQEEVDANSKMIAGMVGLDENGNILAVNRGADAIGVQKFAQANYPAYVKSMQEKKQTPKDINQWLYDETKTRLSYSSEKSDLQQIRQDKTNITVNTGANKQGGGIGEPEPTKKVVKIGKEEYNTPFVTGTFPIVKTVYNGDGYDPQTNKRQTINGDVEFGRYNIVYINRKTGKPATPKDLLENKKDVEPNLRIMGTYTVKQGDDFVKKTIEIEKGITEFHNIMKQSKDDAGSMKSYIDNIQSVFNKQKDMLSRGELPDEVKQSFPYLGTYISDKLISSKTKREIDDMISKGALFANEDVVRLYRTKK